MSYDNSRDLAALRKCDGLTSLHIGDTFVCIYPIGGGALTPDLPDPDGFARKLRDLLVEHLTPPAKMGRPLKLQHTADELRAELSAMRAEGLTHRAAAQRLGVSPGTLRAAQKRLGVDWS